MAVNPNNYVTPTEVENNYEFKLMKKVLRQEYPWIKDVLVPSDEEINKYNLIFLPIVIDPFILQKEVGLPLERWIKRYLTDERYKQTNRQGELDITMRSVGRSAAIPNDLKMGKGRQFSSGEFLIPEMDIPEDAYFYGD